MRTHTDGIVGMVCAHDEPNGSPFCLSWDGPGTTQVRVGSCINVIGFRGLVRHPAWEHAESRSDLRRIAAEYYAS